MTQEALLYVMAAAVGIAALALLLQAGLLFVMNRSVKALKEQIAEMAPRIGSVAESAEKTLQESRKQIGDITARAGDILETTRAQLARTDAFLAEATTRARVQMDRLELVLDDSIGRIHETIALVNDGVLRPLRQINGIAVGVRSAIGYLLRGGRPNVSQATTDEEMFI